MDDGNTRAFPAEGVQRVVRLCMVRVQSNSAFCYIPRRKLPRVHRRGFGGGQAGVHIYLGACMHVHMHACMHVHAHARSRVPPRVFSHVSARVLLHAFLHTFAGCLRMPPFRSPRVSFCMPSRVAFARALPHAFPHAFAHAFWHASLHASLHAAPHVFSHSSLHASDMCVGTCVWARACGHVRVGTCV